MDGDATIEYWIYPTNGAAVDYEGVFGLNASGTNINLERFETAYHNNNYSLYITGKQMTHNQMGTVMHPH